MNIPVITIIIEFVRVPYPGLVHFCEFQGAGDSLHQLVRYDTSPNHNTAAGDVTKQLRVANLVRRTILILT